MTDDAARANIAGIERDAPRGAVRYPDSLVVTESQPPVDYLNSSRMGKLASPDQVSEFGRFLESEIKERGAIHLTKDAGIVIGRA